MKICDARYGKMAYLENDTGIGRNIGLYGEWVQLEIDFLLSLIKPGNTVLDVGANIGSHTIPFSQKVGLTGEVYSFEPQKVLFDILRQNINMSGVMVIWASQSAVGAHDRIMVDLPELDYKDEFNFGGVSLKEKIYEKYIQVPLITIDSLKLRACHLIKADVEGFESEVIKGSLETIKKFKPYIYLENNRPEQLTSIQMMLQSLGYAIFSHTPPTFNPDNFNKVKENPWHGSYLEPNMICLPVEKIQELQDVRWIGKRIL